MADVFISYSRKDGEFVRRLQEALAERDVEVWVDWEDIPPTAEWMNEVEQAVDAADALLFVISPDSAGSEICGRELERAVTNGKRIVPLVRRDVDAALVPEPLRARNWIFCRDTDDFDAAVDTLCSALQTDLDWVREHTRLLVRAVEWDEHTRDHSFLLRGRDLAAAERWLGDAAAHESVEPTPLQHAYLADSRRAATRATRTRFAALSVALVVALVLAVVAFLQRETAQRNETIARSRELAARSNEALAIDPELSVLLARESVAVKDTAEAQQALRQALDTSYVRATIHAPKSTSVGGVGFALDGRAVITAQRDGAAVIWSVKEPHERLAVLCCHDGPVIGAAIDPAGTHVVTASGDGTAKIWDLDDPESPVTLEGHEDYVSSASFSPDGERIVTSSGDRTIRIWDARRGTELIVLEGHESEEGVRQARFDPSGTRVVSAAADGIRVWDATRGGPSTVFIPIPAAPALTAGFSPDGTRIVSGRSDGLAEVWDPQSPGAEIGQPLYVLRGHQFAVESASFSPDGGRIVTTSDDGTAKVWEALAEQSLPPLLTLSGHERIVWSAAFSSDGNCLVTGGDDGTARIWDVRGSDLRTEIRAKDGDLIGDAQLDRSGNRVVLSTDGGLVKIADLRHPEREALVLSGHEDTVNSATFSPDGRRVVSASFDGTARIWDAASGDTIDTLDGYAGIAERAGFSADGNQVITAGTEGREIGDGNAKIWDARDGRLIRTIEAPGAVAAYDATFSPDSSVVAVASSDGKAKIVDARHPQELRLELAATRGGPTTSVDFSPDGRRLLTSGADGRALVWDAERRRDPLLTLSGHIGPVFKARYSPDGSLIVTAGADRTVRVWDATSGAPVSVLRSTHGQVANADFSADGKLIVTADGIARVSRCDLCVSTDRLLRLAEQRSTRELTPAERASYGLDD